MIYSKATVVVRAANDANIGTVSGRQQSTAAGRVVLLQRTRWGAPDRLAWR